MRTSSGCPRRTFDPAHARRVLEADGCVILTGLGRSPEDAVAVAHSVFGTDVLQVPEPSEVRAGGAKDRRPTDLDHSAPLPSHTDGFSYGDRYPDYFLLLCGYFCRSPFNMSYWAISFPSSALALVWLTGTESWAVFPSQPTVTSGTRLISGPPCAASRATS